MTKLDWTMRIAAMVAATVFGTIGCASSGSKIEMEPAGSQTTARTTPEAPATGPLDHTTKPALTGAIYFDTDRWELREDARMVLRSSAGSIQQNPEWETLTIVGHCDERGSDEYNLALGERRATQVKRYLQDLGVSEERLETLSYGESKPAAAGHDESAWKLNRRSEIVVDVHHASTR